MILVLFSVWEDARIWAHCNYSLDMHLPYLGPVSCFPPSWMPLGRTVGGGCRSCWLGGRRHSLFTEMTGDIFFSPHHAIILFAFFLCHFSFPYPSFFSFSYTPFSFPLWHGPLFWVSLQTVTVRSSLSPNRKVTVGSKGCQPRARVRWVSGNRPLELFVSPSRILLDLSPEDLV